MKREQDSDVAVALPAAPPCLLRCSSTLGVGCEISDVRLLQEQELQQLLHIRSASQSEPSGRCPVDWESPPEAYRTLQVQ
ncbi:hypothetical protein GN956_G13375 [Arapaima gigas]